MNTGLQKTKGKKKKTKKMSLISESHLLQKAKAPFTQRERDSKRE